MYFDELPFEDEILDALDAMNFVEMTPVQEQTMPIIMDGHDVISCAQTGTGKTAAYILPLLNNLLNDSHSADHLNAIIMAPTRELAQQIDQQMQGFSYFAPFSSVAVYGGNDGNAWDIQKKGLTHGADIVIATPGRLLSHMKVYNIDFSHIKYFILDEADRMLDMGFYDDIMKIVNKLPKSRQTIMFSATMPPKIRTMAKQIMHAPKEVRIAISRPPETIHQMAYICYEPQKIKLIEHIFQDKTLSKVILFVGKKNAVHDITRSLRKLGLRADEMHSDLEQSARDHVMHEFRNGRVDILVATDIVSRGIDIDDIPLVINYNVPRDAEDYVHRIGRTARAANSGEAITLIGPDEQIFFQRIEKFLEKDIEKLPLPQGFEPGPEYVIGKEEKKKKKSYKGYKKRSEK
ncbi:MAG: DEAD/DEAH box helicase [Paludibacteraceae bacterium]|nr:DEAD/DEAH box helicase [Paludibacteraceae bacterium]